MSLPQVVVDGSDDSVSESCPICLECPMKNPAMLDRCFHLFCFECAVEWARVTPSCPLCKQSFAAVIHSVRSAHSYQRYWVTGKTTGGARRPRGFPHDQTAYVARFGQRPSRAMGRRQTRMGRVLGRHWAPVPEIPVQRVVRGLTAVGAGPRAPGATALCRAAAQWLHRDLNLLLMVEQQQSPAESTSSSATAAAAARQRDDDLLTIAHSSACSAMRLLVKNRSKRALDQLGALLGGPTAEWLAHEVICFLASELSVEAYDDECAPLAAGRGLDQPAQKRTKTAPSNEGENAIDQYEDDDDGGGDSGGVRLSNFTVEKPAWTAVDAFLEQQENH